MSELKELKTAEYQDILNQGGVTVIDFWAPWCGYDAGFRRNRW